MFDFETNIMLYTFQVKLVWNVKKEIKIYLTFCFLHLCKTFYTLIKNICIQSCIQSITL